jgi:dienelactone hydrolase
VSHLEIEEAVGINVDSISPQGDLAVPAGAAGIVLFAHGSGSSRHSQRNRLVARRLQAAGVGTLLLDLLTRDEELVDARTGHLRFDISLLADRLGGATTWLTKDPRTARMRIGYFGASTGAAAALVAAARRPEQIDAVVSRGGRPDLAGPALPAVQAPTLLLVGGDDTPVIPLNDYALGRLGSPIKKLVIVPGASHLFEEPGTLDEVARLAAEWFSTHLAGRGSEGASEPRAQRAGRAE